MTPVASIIIPSYQHAHVLSDAIESALAQSVPCEVIVVDDGSTDDTNAVLMRYGERIKAIRLSHGGPSVARNAGIDAATGEFITLLDADDIIAPDKVATQIAAMDDAVGWVLCDVRIEDAASGKIETASHRYDYAGKSLGGWIQPVLAERNIIPIMAPLVRRSVLAGIRFNDDLIPEDWHFWHAVAGAARVRYVPQVLATYRKSRTGRSRIPAQARKVSRNIVHPLRLNLGCGTQGTRSWHPMLGMVNLDRSMGWRFEDGLGEFVAGSVAGISISHSSMYLPLEKWPAAFAEFYRVLADGGIIRITEDDTSNAESRTYVSGWHDAVTLTNPAMVKDHLRTAGFTVFDCDTTHSNFSDLSLCQHQHGDPPHVFFVEGLKARSVLFSPHNDDEALFSSATILRFRPRVIVCFKSRGDYGDSAIREAETREAMTILGGDPVEQWSGGDLVAQMLDVRDRVKPSRVFAPDRDTSHPDHLAVAIAASEVFGDCVTTYHTYNANGKVRSGKPVAFYPEWTQAKLRALARYESQIKHPRANQFFMNDLSEFYGIDRT